MPRYTALKSFIHPTGAQVAAGMACELSERQAKYLLLAGKVAPEADRKPQKKEK
jgi:hypothetical protein